MIILLGTKTKYTISNAKGSFSLFFFSGTIDFLIIAQCKKMPPSTGHEC